MKSQIVAAATALVLLLLTISAEAKMCTIRSSTWKGMCLHSIDCAGVCVSEGSTGGYCTGAFHWRCICTWQCAAGASSLGDDDAPAPASSSPSSSAGGGEGQDLQPSSNGQEEP